MLEQEGGSGGGGERRRSGVNRKRKREGRGEEKGKEQIKARELCVPSLGRPLRLCVCVCTRTRTHACTPGRLRLRIKIIGAASMPRPPLKKGREVSREDRREAVTKC